MFGLDDEEINWLIKNQEALGLLDKLTNMNKEHDGIEIATSVYKVII